MRNVLYATTALVLFAASAHAQTQTFSSTPPAPAHWPRGQPWAPTFQAAAGDQLGCAWSGTNPIPSDANPISFSASGLVLAVYPTPPDYTATGRPFICGEVTTRPTFSQLYGYFQATIKMPSTNGTMGAFWLNAVDGGWPPEIDIVEALGKSPTMLSVTLHTSDQSAQINKLVPVADMSKGFHTYAVDWNANTITVYFDGNQVFQNATPSDMHKPMYILLDSAVGTCGSWEGCPSGDILDAMTVASVEVWTSNPHLPPPTVVAQASPSVSQPNQSTQQPGEQSVQATVDAQIQASQQQMQADETAAQAEIAAAQAAPDPNAALIKQGDDLAAKADAILNGVLADMGGGN